MTWSIGSASLIIQVVEVILATILISAGMRRGKESTQTSGAPAMVVLSVLFLLLPVALAVWIAFLIRDKSTQDLVLQDSEQFNSFLQAMTMVLIPQVLIQGITTFIAWTKRSSVPLLFPLNVTQQRRKKERVLAGAAAGKKILIVACLITAILYVFLGPPLEILAPIAALLIAAGAGVWTCHQYASTVDESPRHEFRPEHSEVQREILSIASSFGWRPDKVLEFKVLNRSESSPGREGDAQQLVNGLDKWRNSFDPKQPTLPSELIAGTPAEAITAGLAMRYANAALLNPFHSQATGKMSPWLLGAGVFFMLLLLVAALSTSLSFLGFNSGEAFVLAMHIFAIVAFLVAIVSLFLRQREFHRSAFRAWSRAGAAGTDRTPEAFAEALAVYDCSMKPTTSPDSIRARLNSDKRLKAFLNSERADRSKPVLAKP